MSGTLCKRTVGINRAQEQDRRRWKEDQADVVLCSLIRSPTTGRAGYISGSNHGKSGGFGIPRSSSGGEILHGGPSLRESKQALQGLIPGRTHTAGSHGIVLGKGFLTIAIHPALAGRTPPPGKPPSPHVHLTAPPRPFPPNLHVGSSAPASTPSGHFTMGHIHPPGRGQGDRAAPTEQNCKITCLQLQDRKLVIKEFNRLEGTGHLGSSSKNHYRAAAPQALAGLHAWVQLNRQRGTLRSGKELTPTRDLPGMEKSVGKMSPWLVSGWSHRSPLPNPYCFHEGNEAHAASLMSNKGCASFRAVPLARPTTSLHTVPQDACRMLIPNKPG